MHKKKEFLDDLQTLKISNDNLSIRVFFVLENYLTLKDICEETYHLEIFKALYTDDVKSSLDEIAYKFSIGLRTLHRYKDFYNTCARKIHKDEISKCQMLADRI